MAFLIGGANSAADTGFSVANSCRFNDGDSPHMHKTPGSASGTKTKFTFNCWLKRCTLSSEQNLIEAGSSTNERTYVSLGVFATDELSFVHRTGGSNSIVVTGTNLLRDVSAWYMITVKYDSTQGSANDRVRLYINGTEVAYTTQTMPGSNDTTYINDDEIHYISRANHAAERFLDGYLAEVCLIDASALAPTSFGEFNEDSPNIWQPIDVSGLTFGTNGFYLDFESSGNLGNDANGGTDLTEVNLAASDQSQDSPTNNFCTINPLDQAVGTFDISEGNLKYERTSDTESWKSARGTLGIPNAGKWYWEMAKVGGAVDGGFGGIATDVADLTQEVTGFWGFHDGASNENYTIYNTGYTDVGSSYNISDDDIIQIAFDRDNNKLWVGLNNSWGVNGGTPVTPSDPASGFLNISTNVLPAFMIRGTSQNVANFGQDSSFAGNITRQSNSDGNGYGDFYYTPPSGYLAVCTKNIGSDGG